MAVPSSGQLREYADIGVELGVAQSNVSLRGMSALAGFSTPDAMSEFYGYSPSTGTTGDLDIFGDGSCVAVYQLNDDATELSGLYNGTESNITYTPNGKFDQAAVFSGNSQITATSNFPQVEKTISCWVSLDSAITINDVAVAGYGNNATNQYFGIVLGVNRVGVNFFNNSFYRFNYAVPSDGTWFHIMATDIGFSKTIYVNGSSLNSYNPGTYYTGVGNFSIGAGGGKTNLNGRVDQVRIFNKAVTNSSEIQMLLNEGT